MKLVAWGNSWKEESTQKGSGKREARRRGGEERETDRQHNDSENSGLPDLTYGF